MRARPVNALVAAACLAAGCGGPDRGDREEREEARRRAEQGAFGTLVGAPKKVEERTDAAAEQRRENMNRRLEQDEGGSREEPSGD